MLKTTFYLQPDFFSGKEKCLITTPVFSANTFIYPSGVRALRLKNSLGELIMLPYQGMQIWSAEFCGRNITMKSMFSQPNPTTKYLDTYGGFLIHCGFTAMGVPTREDTHPLHGELPNAPFTDAYLELGEDGKGSYLALGGKYQHTVAFSYNYLAEPLVKLYADSSLFNVTLNIKNLKKTPMEFMYLAHINFRPVNDGNLIYSADVSPKTVRIRTSIPSHVKPGPGFIEFLQDLSRHPEKHHHLSPELTFDPEVVFFIDYLADCDGWAHTLQVHPDGSSDYVRHNPKILDHGVRWICRTPDQDAMGMIEAATAEPEGYTAEKAKGNIKILPAGQTFTCEMDMGVLDVDETQKMQEHIKEIINKSRISGKS
jgi:hypothetical protein